jgi:hypothetical protein
LEVIIFVVRRKYNNITEKHLIKISTQKYYKKSYEYWKRLLHGLEKDKCSICGYDKSFSAIEYHHIVGEKKFGISTRLHCMPTKEAIDELNKCIAVCANCHREIHNPV